MNTAPRVDENIESNLGARAIVYISSEHDLRMLAAQISAEVFHVDFYFDTDMDPPHEEFGMCEALGFEVWLSHSDEKAGFNYELGMETSYCFAARFNDNMVDLSPWLEKYLGQFLKSTRVSSA